MLPDIPRKRSKLETQEKTQSSPPVEETNEVITDIFSKIDTIFSSIDHNICDFANEFFLWFDLYIVVVVLFIYVICNEYCHH